MSMKETSMKQTLRRVEGQKKWTLTRKNSLFRILQCGHSLNNLVKGKFALTKERLTVRINLHQVIYFIILLWAYPHIHLVSLNIKSSQQCFKLNGWCLKFHKISKKVKVSLSINRNTKLTPTLSIHLNFSLTETCFLLSTHTSKTLLCFMTMNLAKKNNHR